MAPTWLMSVILLHIMFHGRMGRFQLELIYYITYFSTVIPSKSCLLLSCSPFVLNTTFSTGLVGVEVSSVSWSLITDYCNCWFSKFWLLLCLVCWSWSFGFAASDVFFISFYFYIFYFFKYLFFSRYLKFLTWKVWISFPENFFFFLS